MKILIDGGTYDFLNMGDVAMLQVTVERLRSLWPGSSLRIITDDPGALAAHCPGAIPVPASGKRLWFADRLLLGRLHKELPAPLSRMLVRMKRCIRLAAPSFMLRAVQVKLRMNGSKGRDLLAFLRAVAQADLLVIAGQAAINDQSQVHAIGLLGLMEMANRRRIPVAMMGQSLGPLENRFLAALARKVLPCVSLIALREGLSGPSLLASLGVCDEKIIVTGDDAIELACNLRFQLSGRGVGINLRATAASGVGPDMIDRLRPVLQAFALHHKAPLLGLPIAMHNNGTYDPEPIQQLVAEYMGTSDSGRNLTTPVQLIGRIAECRVVVTGAYHAAVFALAQGIPAVCLAQTPYATMKFAGLRDLFGPGCELIMLDSEDLSATLNAALQRAWESAEQVRGPLRRAAERQIVLSREAYDRLRAIVDGQSAPKGMAGRMPVMRIPEKEFQSAE